MRLADFLTDAEVRALTGDLSITRRELSVRPGNAIPPIPLGCPAHIRAGILEHRAKLAGIDLAERALNAEMRSQLDTAKTIFVA